MNKQTKPAGFGQDVRMSDKLADAKKAMASFGRTDLYSTGYRVINDWLGGGFGKQNAFESVVILGDPGLGKSTLAMQLLKHSVEQGIEQGWAVMEDDHAETIARFINLYDDKAEGEEVVARAKNVHLMSQDMIADNYTLSNITEWIERWASNGVSLFLLDNLQFMFDDASLETNGKALDEHRKFMKRINIISKERGLTTVLVSHTNKNPVAKGMNRILGSSAIAQVATKIIELGRENSGDTKLFMHKNRYAPLNSTPILAKRPIGKFGFEFDFDSLVGEDLFNG